MAKKGSAKSTAANAVVPRKRKATKKQKRRAIKKEARSIASLPNSFKLASESARLMGENWRPIGTVFVIFVILNLLLAGGFSNISGTFGSIREALGNSHSLGQAFEAFNSLLSTTGIANSASVSGMQTVLIILLSLIIIRLLRQLSAGEKIAIKQTIYSSTSSLIPFLLVLLFLILQLLPLIIISSVLYLVLSTLISSLQWVTVVLYVALAPILAWSIYMLSSSVFGLYIVTLPDMQPLQALRSAKNLVRFRRLAVIRKLLFLPLAIVILMLAIMVPLILFAKALVVPIYFGLSILVIVIVHSYLYSLYRSLLK